MSIPMFKFENLKAAAIKMFSEILLTVLNHYHIVAVCGINVFPYNAISKPYLHAMIYLIRRLASSFLYCALVSGRYLFYRRAMLVRIRRHCPSCRQLKSTSKSISSFPWLFEPRAIRSVDWNNTSGLLALHKVRKETSREPFVLSKTTSIYLSRLFALQRNLKKKKKKNERNSARVLTRWIFKISSIDVRRCKSVVWSDFNHRSISIKLPCDTQCARVERCQIF